MVTTRPDISVYLTKEYGHDKHGHYGVLTRKSPQSLTRMHTPEQFNLNDKLKKLGVKPLFKFPVFA